MAFEVQFVNAAAAIVILIMIILANLYQFRVMRRFSGVIGRIMFWYSLGLAAMLALTLFNWAASIFNWGIMAELVGSRLFFLVAVAFFLRGSTIIR